LSILGIGKHPLIQREILSRYVTSLSLVAGTDNQWHPQNLTNHLDGFEILRRGDKNVECRIVLHIDHFPQRFKVLEPLSSLVGMKEGTRAEVMASIWKLVKFTGSQDKDDGSILRPTGGLEKVSTPKGKRG
jgi:SWI/SNF-related matrix-associated actin-dependent regulator of chromatin subfamily D